MRPERGTDEYRLWIAAIEIATSAPLRQGAHHTGFAKIPWTEIHELRDALDAVGIDWRGVKAEYARRRAASNA